jgi:hypothetical protein
LETTVSQITVDDPEVEGENTDRNAGNIAYTDKSIADSDPDDIAILQGDNRLAIAISTSFSPEIPESNSATTLDEKRHLNPSVQGDPIPGLSVKRSRSLSGSGRADGRGNDWVFDAFCEDVGEDAGGTEGDGSPPSKRARSSPPPFKVAENRPSPAAAVVVKGVEMDGSAHGDRPPRGDQEYEVHQIVGESGLEYEATAVSMKSPLSPRSGCPRHRWTSSW